MGIRTRDAIIFCILMCLLMFGAGYAYGTYNTVGLCIHYGIKYLESKNISLGVNEGLIRNDIIRYKNNLG